MIKKGRRTALLFGLAAVLAAGPVSFGRTPVSEPDDFRPPKLWNRVEITLLGGIGIPRAALETLNSAEAGSASDLLAKVRNSIKTSSAPSMFGGAAAAFFLPGGAAFQAGFGYLKAGLACDGTAIFSVSGSAAAEFTATEAGEGELTAVPVFLCYYNRVDLRLGKKTLHLNISLGPTLSFNSVLAKSRAGAVAVRDGAADGYLVPVRVEDATWISVGAMAGLGLDFPLTPSLALTVQGRYFYAARKSLPWTWTTGVYDGILGNLADCEFDERAAQLAAGKTTRFSANPSFVQIAGGIKLVF
jgi:hypothetical protein